MDEIIRRISLKLAKSKEKTRKSSTIVSLKDQDFYDEDVQLPEINKAPNNYVQFGVSVDSIRDEAWVSKYPKVKQKDIPVNYNRRYKAAFLQGVQTFQFEQEDFHNKDHRSEYNVYLQNIENYFGLAQDSMKYHRLKVIQLSSDYVNNVAHIRSSLTGGKKIEYKGQNISITNISKQSKLVDKEQFKGTSETEASTVKGTYKNYNDALEWMNDLPDRTDDDIKPKKGAIREHDGDDYFPFIGVQPKLLDQEGYIGGICISDNPYTV